MQRPEYGDVISEAWHKYTKNLGILIAAFVVIWIITSFVQFPLNVLNILSPSSSNNYQPLIDPGLYIIIALVVLSIFLPLQVVVGAWLGIGERNILLAATDDKPLDFVSVFKPNGMFWRYLGTTILVGLIVFGGLLLFIVPGIYFAIRFSFAANAIVDKRMNPTEALGFSSKLTLNNKWYLIGWGFLMFGINVLGLMALFVGVIFTIPFTALATMVLYRKLTSLQTETLKAQA